MNRKKRKWGTILILSGSGLCLGITALFAIMNLFIPDQTNHPDQLADVDIARVLEAQHLRQKLGDQVFPYSLVASIFFPNTDTYLSMIQHESFHAFQAVWAQPRFDAAEWDGIRLSDQYLWENLPGIDAWQQELDIIKAALKSEDKEEARQLAQQFLDHRDARRKTMQLSVDLIRYENQLEWVEGMARYAELETWRLAWVDQKYKPLADMHSDRKFKEYQSFENRWSRELDQISRMADDEGDGRFYYSGMAQAYLLDQLHPSWKLTLAADPMLNLEDLLRQALTVQ
jgi:hypothetical protein